MARPHNARARRCVVASLMVALLACTLPSSHTQGVSVRNQNLYQCFNSVNLAGSPLQTVSAPNADACALQCSNTQGCSSFSLGTSQQCTLKAWALESGSGTTGRDTSIRTSCLHKTRAGALPAPDNNLCFSGQDVAGVELSRVEGLASPAACASRCVVTPGCSFSVFRALSTSSSGNTLCQLKANAFAGNEDPSVTRRDPGVTGLCFRALAVPAVIDPLSLVAGPVPFLIVTKTSLKCLRPASPPYSAGMSPLFMSDCSSVEALWTFSSDTKLITHYASGLCLAPADSSNGAVVLLSSNCTPSSANQIMARGAGGLQMFYGNRHLLPITLTATEGSSMVASSLLPQEQYNFLPAPGLAYQCYAGVEVSGDSVAPATIAANSLACASLCQASPGCTFYTFSTAGLCSLRYNPFNSNGVPSGAARSPQVAEVCFNKAKSGTLPSPSNYLCYNGQQVSGSILRTFSAANPQACVDSCSATPGCTFSYYDTASGCTLGSNAFFGSQGNDMNRLNADILNLCLRATGAPDTIATKGYACYDDVYISGDQLLSTSCQVASKDACIRLCEAESHVCTVAVYNASSRSCDLLRDAFMGGTNGRSEGDVSCLRSASGGPMNSPGNYLCYGSQSLAGTEIARVAGVADSAACAQTCTAVPGCTFTLYLPVSGGTCILKKDPFYGNELAVMNAVDPLITSTCLAAPGAPLVLSGFGRLNLVLPCTLPGQNVDGFEF